MRTAGAIGAAVVLLIAGCDDSPSGPGFSSLEDFSALPAFEELDYSGVTPGGDYDYWELRFSFEAQGYQVLGSGGSKSKVELEPDVLEAFEAAHPQAGFDVDCLPGYCYKYVASVDGASVELWASPERLSSFLAPLDSEADAILFAKANGYYWVGDDVETGAIRAVSDGYELVVLRLVESCAPVRTDRFRLYVSRVGGLSVKASEVWSEDLGACI
jgi:hypothetical protein